MLTIASIKAVRPTDKRQEIPDRDGLYLLVQPSGAMSWAWRYRSPSDRKVRKLTIGAYPAYGLKEARDAAHEARKRVQRGIDPVETAKVEREKARDRANIASDVLDEYFKAYAKTHKPSSHAEAKRLAEKWAKPVFGDKRIEDVTRRDVQTVIDNMIAAGAPISANRMLAVLKPFFASVRIGKEPLPSLPTAGVDKPTSEKGRDRDRVLSVSEIGWLWRATDDATPFSAAVRLMLATGQRRSEVSGMTTLELDLEADPPVWLLPSARTKNGRENLVPLSRIAIEAIKRPPHIGRSRLVLTSVTGTELSGWSKPKVALDARVMAVATELTGRPPNIEPWTLHDLRRTAASHMARLKCNPHVIEAVLNHKSGEISGVAAVYNRYAYFDEKREALTAWADEIERLARD